MQGRRSNVVVKIVLAASLGLVMVASARADWLVTSNRTDNRCPR